MNKFMAYFASAVSLTLSLSSRTRNSVCDWLRPSPTSSFYATSPPSAQTSGKSPVTKGIHVRPGTPIALTGNSGRGTDPHLHLTLKDTKKGRAIDPSILLRLIIYSF